MEDVAGIYEREVPSIDRFVQLGVASGKVLRVKFREDSDPDAGTEHPFLDRLVDLLEGRTETEFEDVPVALTVPTEQRAVLEALQSVPYGRSISVEGLVRMTPGLDPDAEEDQRTVRAALRDNPAPVFIPDHRVRNASGATPPVVADHLRSIEGIEA